MNFNVEAVVNCCKCKADRMVFDAAIEEECPEDFSLGDFEEAASEFFKNHDWVKFAAVNNWLCPACWEARNGKAGF